MSLSWSFEPGDGAHVSGCQVGSFTSETAPVFRECKWNWDGTIYSATVWIAIDRTPPQITGLQTARPADHAGWFNRPVSLEFLASDALSGVDGCTSTVHSGPGGAVAGRCTDVAGNAQTGTLPIRYDSTAPSAPDVTARPGNRRMRVRWTAAADATAEVTRHRRGRSRVVYRGAGGSFLDKGLRNGRRYRYTVALVDQAGNRSVDRAGAVPTSSPLLTPAAGAKVTAPPLLTWRRVRGASYYNVQLFRGSKKVLSRWPVANELQLTRRWRFAGEGRRLVAGRYCYFVWPGSGPRDRRNYGEVLGERCFRVAA